MGESGLNISRRGFMAGAGAAAIGAGLAGCSSGTADNTSLSDTSSTQSVYDPEAGEWIPTKCNMCFNRCAILAHVVDGVVVELKGNEASEIGGGRMCGKGASGIMQLYDPNRITKPLKRTNPNKGFDQDPGWEEISWEEAYDICTTELKKAADTGPGGLAYSSMIANNQAWQKSFVTFGAIFGNFCQGVSADICGAGIHMASDVFNGTGNGQPDYQYCKYLIQFGTQAGTATRHGYNMSAHLFSEARKNGCKLVSFDPHMSHGADASDLWVPIRPGTDAAAALSIANVLLNELNIWDAEYLAKRTNGPALVDSETGRILRQPDTNKAMFMDADGVAKPYNETTSPQLEGAFQIDGRTYRTAFDVYREHMLAYTPEYQESITTVPAATIRKVAKEFGEAARIGETIEIDGVTMPYRPACADLFSGVSRHKHSMLSNIAIMQLNVLVGSCNMPGGLIGFAPRCEGWTDDNHQMSWEIDLWEEDGFINGNSLFYPRKASVYEDIRAINDKVDNGKLDAGMLAIAPWNCPADTHFYHVNQCRPEVYNNMFNPTKAMFVLACNPVKWMGNHDEMAEMYKGYDFVVGCDIYLNDSSYFYDILLPEACYLERYDVFPNLFLAHHTPGGIGIDWSIDICQPVVPARDGCPTWLDHMAEFADRLGRNKEFITALNAAYSIKEEYSVPLDQKLSVEAFYDSAFKSLIDEEHDLEWFKKNGVYRYPRKLEEVYIWSRDDIEGRVPLYFDNFFEAKERIQKVVTDLNIPWELDDWQPMPDWKPCNDHEIVDAEYDIMPIYWTNSLNTDTWQTQNAYINEQNELDPRVYGIEMNSKTAVNKGLREGDEVRLVSREGVSVEGRLTLSEGVHEECVAVVGGHWGAKSEYLPIAKGKGVPINHLMTCIDPARYDHASAAYDQCCRVKVEKIG